MQHRLFTLLFLLLFSHLLLSAQKKVSEVHGVATIYLTGDMTINMAEKEAIRQAKINALAEKYGTTIAHSTHDYTHSTGTEIHSNFQTIGTTEVRGQWISDVKPPKVLQGFDETTRQIWCKAEVWGRARELKNDQVELDIQLLANGTEDVNATTTFKEGDRLRISLRSAAAGFVAIYLLDKANQTAQLLIPNPDEKGSNHPESILAKKKYLFFDSYEEEILLACSQPTIEYNQVYVLFSPENYSLPLNEEIEGLSKSLTWDQVRDLTKGKGGEFYLLDSVPEGKFQDWLAKHRARDEHFQVNSIEISIKKNL